MQHTIPVDSLGPAGAGMASAVEKCVHCGFCLSACPTYLELGEEMDSPRGRIVLMKSVLEGELALEEALPYVDRCLGCLGCVTVCPSGVPYGELVTPFRAYARTRRQLAWQDRTTQQVALKALMDPGLFRLAARAGRLAKPLQPALPHKLGAMLDLLPEKLPAAAPLPERMPAKGSWRARVALLAGCVQQALAPELNWATLRVLAHNGVEVVIPPGQGCCGALAMHVGQAELARQSAEDLMARFPEDVDAIITNAAGCSSGIKEYPWLFRDPAWSEKSDRFQSKIMDIHVFLDELGLLPPPPLPKPLEAAYHDACHLAHAQKIVDAPRRLLGKIPNLKLLPLAESDLCCGSAGMYSLEHPETARALGARKARNLIASGAQVVLLGNIGCMVQIRNHLQAAGRPLPVMHTIELLDEAYRLSDSNH